MSDPQSGAITQRYYRQEKLLIEKSHPGPAPVIDWQRTGLKSEAIREDPGHFPDLNEIEVVRHFTRLSMRNYSVEEGLYPLGSCTMKYNPRVHEAIAALPGFRNLHPCQPESHAQGALRVLYEFKQALCALIGMDDATLQGAAGAQGEFVGLKVINAYHAANRERRSQVLILDSAHGTNAASSARSGLKVVPVASSSAGVISAEAVAKKMTGEVAALMITIPNTLGIFEDDIVAIARVVHDKGGLVYCDGANLNALLGRVNFKQMGVDVMHVNLHKTFSTPHGGGGPGSGPVATIAKLGRFLPSPDVAKEGDTWKFIARGAHSIGRVQPYHGSFAVVLRAYAYILAHGGPGLRSVADCAVLNANYLRKKLEPHYDLPFPRPCLHEVVFSDKRQKEHHVTTMDIAKRLMDYGFHPPTVYFPLIAKGALMIEPTETVNRQELDRFVEAMIAIAKESSQNPELVQKAPHALGIRRLDEVRAARKPVLTWDRRWHEDQ